MRNNSLESASGAFVSSALEKSTFVQPVTVYRGVNVSVYDHLQLRTGTVIGDKAFLSTTRDPKIAYYISTGKTEISEKKSTPGLRGLVLEIPLAVSQRGIDMMLVSKESFYAEEQEILLPANTRLSVEGVKEVDGVAYVKTKVVTDTET